jgi:hypothetical protein
MKLGSIYPQMPLIYPTGTQPDRIDRDLHFGLQDLSLVAVIRVRVAAAAALPVVAAARPLLVVVAALLAAAAAVKPLPTEAALSSVLEAVAETASKLPTASDTRPVTASDARAPHCIPASCRGMCRPPDP